VKIAIVSDTHVPRFAKKLPAAVRHVAAERPDLILHCGDLTTFEAIEAFARIAPVEAVAGNNDGEEIVARYGRRKIVTTNGVKIGMIHGDGGERASTLDRARAAFAHDAVDAIVFGHSHVPFVELRDGVWTINPGSVTDKRLQPRFSFAVLERDAHRALVARHCFFDAEG